MKFVSVEEQVMKAVINSLLEAGYALGVNDGEEETVTNSRDPDEVFAAMKTTDQDYLLARKPTASDAQSGWVRFIYGNEGHEVVNDYTTNLEPVMGPIFEALDEFFH